MAHILFWVRSELFLECTLEKKFIGTFFWVILLGEDIFRDFEKDTLRTL